MSDRPDQGPEEEPEEDFERFRPRYRMERSKAPKHTRKRFLTGRERQRRKKQ